MNGYKTLRGPASAELTEKRSVFICRVRPVTTEAQALAFLAEVRKQCADARHNVYAYTIRENGIARFSDDGEPGGTAGMPIIEVMKARGVTNCAVVVTRYFGGILLGAGGLTRAYARGATAALNACGVGGMHPTARYLVDVPYPMLSRVEYFLASAPVVVEEKTFADVVTLNLVVKCMDEETLLKQITDLSEGRLEPMRFEELYRAWPED